ncbi:adenosylcobinamide-GDP ribazoletransferase [Rossellomorea aquimaris]|uniref:Adenosylcobinamide-GDP ribazoletransferase n=1 Tax=Rossellomorea aquimaris TaxID=189382 RepID=A0A366F0C6_9BACI|nr:adenosylcobinamide-GDP ribazoletransferase [Rossellomorea aquimaris]RBP08103.1 cobalamin-5'-phosphate synthase [Rossellomorea aquimaris]
MRKDGLLMILFKSFLLNLQFFTILPIRKEFSIGKREMKWMVRTFPLLGLFVGVFLLGGYVFLNSLTHISPLGIAFFIWVMPIVLTGGIHLDGYMDASDAFFSYRDKKKRLDIMKDPRVGAFGVLSLVVLLSSKFLFIYETILQTHSPFFIVMILVSIPFLSRMMMGASLILIPAAQTSGMGYGFRKNMTGYDLIWIVSGLLLGGVGSFYLNWFYFYALFTLVALAVFWFVYSRSIKWFGGMSGDTIGASVEGVELCLWMTIWLLHVFAMV